MLTWVTGRETHTCRCDSKGYTSRAQVKTRYTLYFLPDQLLLLRDENESVMHLRVGTWCNMLFIAHPTRQVTREVYLSRAKWKRQLKRNL